MTRNLVGTRVQLRLYVPGDSFSAFACGTIVEHIPTGESAPFHDGYRIELDDSVQIDIDTVKVVYIVLSRDDLILP